MCNARGDVRFTPDSDHESGHVLMVMSALPPKADMCSALGHVRLGPKADIRFCGGYFRASPAQTLRVDDLSSKIRLAM